MVEVISNVVHGRFFVGYRGGNCIRLSVDINTFIAFPKKITNFKCSLKVLRGESTNNGGTSTSKLVLRFWPS